MVIWITYINQLYYQMYSSQLCQNTVYWSLIWNSVTVFCTNVQHVYFQSFFFNAYSHSKVSLLFNTFTYIVTNHCFFFFFHLSPIYFFHPDLISIEKEILRPLLKRAYIMQLKRLAHGALSVFQFLKVMLFNYSWFIYIFLLFICLKRTSHSAAAAKSLQSCPTVRPHRQQPTRLPVPGILQARILEWGCHFLLQCIKVKVKSLSRVWLLAIPWTAAYQAPPSMGFSRQEYWSGVPLPSLPLILVLLYWKKN